MTPTERAAALGAEHGARDAEAFTCPRCDAPLREGPYGYYACSRGGPGHHSTRALPEPDLSGDKVAEAIEHYVADGDVDQRYDLRQAYEAAYRAAVEETIQAHCATP